MGAVGECIMCTSKLTASERNEQPVCVGNERWDIDGWYTSESFFVVLDLNTPEARGNSHSLSRTNLRSQTMSTQKITSSTGLRRQLSAENLIGQHGGSERLSKSDRKPKTSWTETRGSSCSPTSTTSFLVSAATTAATPSGELSVRKRRQLLLKHH